MTNEMKNEPELRFPGFKDGWEENFISEVVDFYSGLTYSPDDITNEKGTFVIRSSNIKNNRLINADNVYVNLKNLKVEKVDKGDIIVVVRNGSRKLIGKHALVSTYLNNTVIGAFMTGIRSDYNLFINALLDTENFKRNIHMNLGATINQITTGMFKKMKFYFPKNQEQQIIGDFFSKLDRQIELEEQKLEKLEEQKKGYMQQIFSQKLRFKDESGKIYPDWEKRKLNEIADFQNGKAHESYVSETGNYILVNSKFISTEAQVKKYVSQQLTPLNQQDIAIVMSDIPNGKALAKCFLVEENNKYSLNQRIGRLYNILGDSRFVYAILNRNKQLLKYDSGVGQTNLKKSEITEIMINWPVQDEQQKIGNLFRRFDDFIEGQSQKIELLKDRKKGFLQKMFV
ncbi:restriction endonuclease subunit S [Staphylococcus caeli]|uniref:Type I restriction-modification system specificity protein n=1 Tax=Staphylococcus caeli TaxID=2201815 RepID=A0A1D4MHU9_9STAP|nr:restriction endonuclease subunit S [Staphylococcus caeli]AWM30161.1 type-I restriction modification DNA specificity protein [Staphylococcus caeli]SCS78383.1 type I restriction-modification system specificity protein [Staphylococcus caeli]SCS98033.1 type I restriction-modification system specificity protein [Staphylococcus caeli]